MFVRCNWTVKVKRKFDSLVYSKLKSKKTESSYIKCLFVDETTPAYGCALFFFNLDYGPYKNIPFTYVCWSKKCIKDNLGNFYCTYDDIEKEPSINKQIQPFIELSKLCSTGLCILHVINIFKKL